jgi:hypothetical protein
LHEKSKESQMMRTFLKTVPILRKGTPQLPQIAVTLFTFVWAQEIIFSGKAGWLALVVMPYPLRTAKELMGTYILLALIAAWLTLNASLVVLLSYRQTAARYIELILTVFGAILIIVGNLNVLNGTNVLLIYFANAIATSLLFTKPSNIWFGKLSTSTAQQG